MHSTFPPFDLIFWEKNKNPVQKNLHGIFRGIVICLLIVLCSEFKVCFWMSAYWANFWRFFAKVDVTTVAATRTTSITFLNSLKVVSSYFASLDVFAQLFVAFFVFFLDLAYFFKQECDVIKTFFSCFFCEGCVHIGPLIVLASCCIFEVFYCIADAAIEQFEPDFSMFFFVVCCPDSSASPRHPHKEQPDFHGDFPKEARQALP